LVDDLPAVLPRDLLLALLTDELLRRAPVLVLVLRVRPLRLVERRAETERALDVLPAGRALERDLAWRTDVFLAQRDLPAGDLAFLLTEQLGLYTHTHTHTIFTTLIT